MVSLKSMPDISFLILTFNSERFVDTILGSIFDKCGDRIKKGKFELLILDNNSSDTTSEKIESFIKKYPDLYEIDIHKDFKKPIYFHKSKVNLGYAKGINRIASFASGKILLIINPDAELLEEDFEKLISEFEENEKLAIAGLKIIDKDGKSEKTAGKFMNIMSFFLFALGLEEIFSLRFSPNKKQKVNYVSGGFTAFNNKLFHTLHGYDESYFMYVEDMDIGYRAKKLNLEVNFLPYATIKHQGQGSSNRTFAIVNIYKGLQVFYKKHKTFIELWIIKNLLLIKAVTIIFISIVLGKKDLKNTYSEALKTIQ